MSREVIVTLPAIIEINGAKDAPQAIRTVKTDKFESDFIVDCIAHALSQKIGDPLSNKKNLARIENATRVHGNLENGIWSDRAKGTGGITEEKLLANVAKIDPAKLVAQFTPEQLTAIIAAQGNIQAVTLKK